jgi:hypothetical protein
MKESPIFTRTYDLVCWLIPLTVKLPRQQRFVIAEALQRTALTFQECLIEAGSTNQPLVLLKEADILLTKLRLYLRLSRDLQLISLGQYAHAAEKVTEIGRLLGGWQKSLRE